MVKLTESEHSPISPEEFSWIHDMLQTPCKYDQQFHIKVYISCLSDKWVKFVTIFRFSSTNF